MSCVLLDVLIWGSGRRFGLDRIYTFFDGKRFAWRKKVCEEEKEKGAERGRTRKYLYSWGTHWGEPTIVSKAEAIHNPINRQPNNSNPMVTIIAEARHQKLEYASQWEAQATIHRVLSNSIYAKTCVVGATFARKLMYEVLESRDNGQLANNNGRPFNAVNMLLLK
jgi:hypothetical protein